MFPVPGETQGLGGTGRPDINPEGIRGLGGTRCSQNPKGSGFRGAPFEALQTLSPEPRQSNRVEDDGQAINTAERCSGAHCLWNPTIENAAVPDTIGVCQ